MLKIKKNHQITNGSKENKQIWKTGNGFTALKHRQMR